MTSAIQAFSKSSRQGGFSQVSLLMTMPFLIASQYSDLYLKSKTIFLMSTHEKAHISDTSGFYSLSFNTDHSFDLIQFSVIHSSKGLFHTRLSNLPPAKQMDKCLQHLMFDGAFFSPFKYYGLKKWPVWVPSLKKGLLILTDHKVDPNGL